MKIYQYRSPIGRFLIKPQANCCWGLWFKRKSMGTWLKIDNDLRATPY